METYQVAVLPGDGVGPEVMNSAVEILEALAPLHGLTFSFHHGAVGAGEFLRCGDPLPDEAFRICEESDAVLLGAMGLPSVRWPDGKEMTPQIDLRERLDLYAGLRPIYLYAAEDSPLKNFQPGEIDLLLVRENTEGLFSARLSTRDPDQQEARDVMRITRTGSLRICRAAFEAARARRQKVTLVDKANVLPSMVFLREVFQEVARDYPNIETECVYVDAAALYLVKRPETFDVMVTENMFGDILSDLAAGIVGGMGMAPSADIGDHCAVFQPSHGTAPDIAGQGIANPVAMILSAAMMLEWLPGPQARAAAAHLREAVTRALGDPSCRTSDMGGSKSTADVTQAVLAAVTQGG